jgi:hypothetical protein
LINKNYWRGGKIFIGKKVLEKYCEVDFFFKRNVTFRAIHELCEREVQYFM